MLPLLREDIVFVELSGLGLWNEAGKNAGILQQHHGIAGVVPAVEIAHDGDGQRVRSPYRKGKAPDTADLTLGGA